MVDNPCGPITHLHHVRPFHPHPSQGPVHHDQSLKVGRGWAVIWDISDHPQWKNSESCALASLTSHSISRRMLTIVGSLLRSLASSVKIRISSGWKSQSPVKLVRRVVRRHVWGRIKHTHEELPNIVSIIHTAQQFLGRPCVIDSDLKWTRHSSSSSLAQG